MTAPLGEVANYSTYLSARSPGSRLVPEWLSLPDRLPESEALLRLLVQEEFWELGLLSSSSQPPPACPGWCLTAERPEWQLRPQGFPQTSGHLRDSEPCPELTGQLQKPQAHKMGMCFLPPALVTLLPRHEGTVCTSKGGNPCLHTSGPQDGLRESIPRVGMCVACQRCHCRLVGVTIWQGSLGTRIIRPRTHSISHYLCSPLDGGEEGFTCRACPAALLSVAKALQGTMRSGLGAHA